jgi:hypothetical protein
MNVSEHAKILKAYIDRLSMPDLKIITQVHGYCWDEQLNGNAESQRSEDEHLQSVILNALGQMLTHDRDNIARIIDNTLNRKG